MQTTSFVNYLIEIEGLAPGSAITRCRKCERIEEVEAGGDLDSEYSLDRLHRISHLFDYSNEDAVNGRPQRHHIPIRGSKGFRSIYEGTKDYQSSLKKYIEFMDYVSNDPEELKRLQTAQTISDGKVDRRISKTRTSNTRDWPNWGGPSNEEHLTLARIITKYIRFLKPEIVEAIAEDNARRSSEWREMLLQCGVEPSEYLWQGSPCAFPGVRRHRGTNEINAFRDKSVRVEGALALDDNSYPKQIWSFVFHSTPFSMQGPKGYQLAHLIDHKDTGTRLSAELVNTREERISAIPGLFTSAANATYVPVDFLKPTDFEGSLRNLLQRKAMSLYSQACEPLPSGIKVAESYDEGWELSDFEWADPVGTLEYVEDFLGFRNNRMTELFSARLNLNEE